MLATINPLKCEVWLISYLREKQCLYVTKIIWLILFMEIITVYSGNFMKPINITCVQNAGLPVIKTDGAYVGKCILKG
jgi:hypothetical protein